MPGEPGRPRDRDVDRRILGAARALLRERGLDGLTMSAVAAAAGVGRPTVYRRYATPQQIAMDVLYADLDRLAAAPPTLDDHAVVDWLIEAIDPFLRYYAEDPPLSGALLQLSLFSEGDWQARFSTQVMVWLQALTSELEAAKPHRLHADVDTLVLVRAFFGTYLAIVIGGTRGLLDLDAQRATLRACLAQHLRGLVP